jgi:hypothetical protein
MLINAHGRAHAHGHSRAHPISNTRARNVREAHVCVQRQSLLDGTGLHAPRSPRGLEAQPQVPLPVILRAGGGGGGAAGRGGGPGAGKGAGAPIPTALGFQAPGWSGLE